MKFFSLISSNEIHEANEEKVIPAKDFETLKKAADLLKLVKKEALQYKKEVATECETIKELAYKEGYQQGLTTFNEKLLHLDAELKKIKEEATRKILPIALKAAQKILGAEIELAPEKIADIIMQALKPVTQSHKVIIYVNKLDLETLEKNKSKIKKVLGQVKDFSIQERLDVEPGGCLIETEAGIINAQLSNQWRALETAFNKYTNQ